MSVSSRMRTKVFIVSALLAIGSLVVCAVSVRLFNTSLGGHVMTLLIGCFGLFVAVPAYVSSLIFKQERMLAICGALAGSCVFISVLAVFVAWHHYTTSLR